MACSLRNTLDFGWYCFANVRDTDQMKPNQSCEYCERVGIKRLIDALHGGRAIAIMAVLCNECFILLGDGETEIWAWFRQKYNNEK